MFVDATPNSQLLSLLKKTEEMYKIYENKRVKFVEKPGMKIINRVSLADPFRRNCTEDDCLSCKDSDVYTNCRKFNIGYSLVCKLCEERGITRVYQGESSRSLYLRSKDHVRDLRKENKHSVMDKHIKEEHENEKDKVTFKMKKTGNFKTPLSRIINEGLRIMNTKPSNLLNSKNEHYGPSVRRKT